MIQLARRKNNELSVSLLRYREEAVVSIVDKSLLGRELSVSWNNFLYMEFAKIRLTEMQ